MAVSPAHLRERGIPYWKQFIVSGCYTGLAPIASGTVGSALAALVYFIPGAHDYRVMLALGVIAFVVGVRLAKEVEPVVGPDSSFITIDEFSGQWLTLVSPFVLPNPYWVILCFIVFRVFDIAKLWPASYFEGRPGGVGVMADDVAAAVYANVSAHLIWYGLLFIRPALDFIG